VATDRAKTPLPPALAEAVGEFERHLRDERDRSPHTVRAQLDHFLRYSTDTEPGNRCGSPATGTGSSRSWGTRESLDGAVDAAVDTAEAVAPAAGDPARAVHEELLGAIAANSSTRDPITAPRPREPSDGAMAQVGPDQTVTTTPAKSHVGAGPDRHGGATATCQDQTTGVSTRDIPIKPSATGTNAPPPATCTCDNEKGRAINLLPGRR